MKRPSHADLEEELARKFNWTRQLSGCICSHESDDFTADLVYSITILTTDATADAGKSMSPDPQDMPCKGGANRNGDRGLASMFDDDIPGLPLGVTDNPLENELPNTVTNRQNRINWSSRKSEPRTQPVDEPLFASYQYSPAVQKAIESILYIADHIKKEDDDNNVSQ